MITVTTEYTPTGAALHQCSFDNRTFAACYFEIAQAMDLEPELTGGRVEFYGSEDELVALTHAAETDFHARMMPESAPVAAQTPAIEAPATKPAKVRCPHYKAIRRAFAIARDAGLDCSKAGKARARHAMEDVIGQCVNSRAEYSGSDWMRFGDAIKAGRSAW